MIVATSAEDSAPELVELQFRIPFAPHPEQGLEVV